VASGFVRVRSPGLTLTYVAAAFCLAATFWGPRSRRMWAVILLGLTSAGLLASLNRNMVLGLLAGFLVAVVFAKHRTIAVTALISGALIATCGLIVIGGAAANGVADRFLQLTDYKYLVDTTLGDRYYETGLAVAALSREPITGLGWGSDYGARLSTDPNSSHSLEPRLWLHNQYLYLWLQMGLAAVLVTVVLIGRAMAAGARWAREAEDGTAWIGLGLVIALVALAASATVGMYLSSEDSIVPLAGLVALGFVLRNSMKASAGGSVST
jgi:O-antigen ligase